MTIKAILFDLDGTLLDREASLLRFLKFQFRRKIKPNSNVREETFIREFLALDAFGMNWKGTVYSGIIDKFQINGVRTDDLLNDYITNFHRFCVGFEGLQEALSGLSTGGFSMALVSNGRYPFQLDNAKAINIDKYISHFFVSDQEGVRKPNPEIFHRALKSLRSSADEAIFVGDHPRNDILAAKFVGMRTIWRPSKAFSFCEEADFVCDNLYELPTLINKANQNRNGTSSRPAAT